MIKYHLNITATTSCSFCGSAGNEDLSIQSSDLRESKKSTGELKRNRKNSCGMPISIFMMSYSTVLILPNVSWFQPLICVLFSCSVQYFNTAECPIELFTVSCFPDEIVTKTWPHRNHIRTVHSNLLLCHAHSNNALI